MQDESTTFVRNFFVPVAWGFLMIKESIGNRCPSF